VVAAGRQDAAEAEARPLAAEAPRGAVVAEVRQPAEAAAAPDVAAGPRQVEVVARQGAAVGRLPVAAARQAQPLAAASAPASSVLEVLCRLLPAQAPGQE
jgi:hypothetical protein